MKIKNALLAGAATIIGGGITAIAIRNKVAEINDDRKQTKLVHAQIIAADNMSIAKEALERYADNKRYKVSDREYEAILWVYELNSMQYTAPILTFYNKLDEYGLTEKEVGELAITCQDYLRYHKRDK